MQMVMMVFRTSTEAEVLSLVEQEQLPFTRLNGAEGKGAHGHTAPGLWAWEGPNTMLFVAVPDDRLSGFRDRVHHFQDELKTHPRSAGLPFHIFVLPCVQWF